MKQISGALIALLFPLSSAGAQTYAQDWIDVKAYGAQLNGVNDDTTAYQNARTAAILNGMIYVPQGQQNISANPTGGPTTPVLWLLSGDTYPDGVTSVISIGKDEVETFLGAGGKYFGRGASIENEGPVVRIDNKITHTGGSGGVVPALTVNTMVSSASGLSNKPWGIVSQLTTNGSGGTALALAAYSTRSAAGAEIFGINTYASSTSGLKSSVDGAMVAQENDITANDDDDGGAGSGNIPAGSGVRVGLDVLLAQANETDAAPVAGWGVRVGGRNGSTPLVWKRGFAMNGACSYACVTTEFATEQSGAAAFRMASGQHLDFTGDSAHTLSYLASALTYIVGGAARLQISDSGDATIAGKATIDGGLIVAGALPSGIAQRLTGSTIVGLDTSGGTFSGPAMRIGTGQHLSVTSTSDRTISYQSGSLVYGKGTIGSQTNLIQVDDNGNGYLMGSLNVAGTNADSFLNHGTLATTASVGFSHPFPAVSGSPTGTPANSSTPACEWNTSSHALNCYDGAGWFHLTASPGAG
ncbi:MAG: hypothetical protein J0I21_06455 [Alphaproteobacteria bacterium]|nr:hypothetical protein [Alphaproteobacteria bacterium]